MKSMEGRLGTVGKVRLRFEGKSKMMKEGKDWD